MSKCPQVEIMELKAMVKGYQANEQRTAPLYRRIAQLKAEKNKLERKLYKLEEGIHCGF